jgi:hypothetical protein
MNTNTNTNTNTPSPGVDDRGSARALALSAMRAACDARYSLPLPVMLAVLDCAERAGCSGDGLAQARRQVDRLSDAPGLLARTLRYWFLKHLSADPDGRVIVRTARRRDTGAPLVRLGPGGEYSRDVGGSGGSGGSGVAGGPVDAGAFGDAVREIADAVGGDAVGDE